ncbi:MAG: hypothetical protein M0R06_01450 [Sphaerochaeta sp.]|nr:hypothetical protein [Sphaerochaeta sp.]
MTEKSLWRYLQVNMKGRWDACRHEDGVTVGVPDVSYGINGRNGWIELKVMNDYPKRTKFLDIKNLTGDQRHWINNRYRRGGSCWILLKVKHDYVLFSGRVVFEIGQRPVKDIARFIWYRSIDWAQFETILSER